MQSEKIDLLVQALVKVQAGLKPVVKNKINRYFKSEAHPKGSPYADLESMWESCRELLSQNGLAVIQTTEFINNNAVLKTQLCHISGQWVDSDYPLNPEKPTPQSLGSALTYGRRYSFESILGLVSTEDDDGEEAMNRGNTTAPKPQAPHYSNKEVLATSPLPKPIAGFQVQNDTAELGNNAPWPEGTMVSDNTQVSDNTHTGEYVVSFGKKNKGKTLNEMGPQEVRSYLNWLKSDADKKGEALKGAASEFADAAEAYLNTNEEVPF